MGFLDKIISTCSFKSNVLVVGSDGMLGQDVCALLETKPEINVLRTSSGWDFSVPGSFEKFMLAEHPDVVPDVVVNCAAFTDTAAAEKDRTEQHSKYAMSFRANALLPEILAQWCLENQARFIHISTDHVFSQHSRQDDKLLTESDPPFPVNMYGLHKHIGELKIQNVFKHKTACYAILRTSWLYGIPRSKSFVHKVLGKYATIKELPYIWVNSEAEHSIPTSTSNLSKMIYNVIRHNIAGTVHACDKGEPVSRGDWVKQIISLYDPDMLVSIKWESSCERQNANPDFSAMVNTAVDERLLFDGIEHPDSAEDLACFFRDNENSLRAYVKSFYYM